MLDDDPDHVEECRKYGFRVFYGDATRLDLLYAAGAASADFLIITLDDAAAASRLARTASKHFPRLRIIALLAERGPLPVNEVSTGIGLSQPLISWHLRIMRLAGVV